MTLQVGTAQRAKRRLEVPSGRLQTGTDPEALRASLSLLDNVSAADAWGPERLAQWKSGITISFRSFFSH